MNLSSFIQVQRIRNSILDWALRRSPRSRQLTLSQKRIYIMPSAAGFGFILMLSVMLLLSINYQNNLAFAVTFLLASLFVVTIIHTYANLSGLQITFLRGHPCFAGENAAFDIRLSADSGRQHESLELSWKAGQRVSVDLISQSQATVTLYQKTSQRGVIRAGVMSLQTYYPLGLLRAWSWLDADLEVVVYPAPVAGGVLPEQSGIRGDGDAAELSGIEEFSGLEPFQQGMSPKHIAWKQYARGQGLHAKQFSGYADKQRWLSWNYWPELDVEARLSRLSWWVLQLEKQGEYYGLQLPSVEIAPGRGERHRNRVLEVLATYPRDDQTGTSRGTGR